MCSFPFHSLLFYWILPIFTPFSSSPPARRFSLQCFFSSSRTQSPLSKSVNSVLSCIVLLVERGLCLILLYSPPAPIMALVHRRHSANSRSWIQVYLIRTSVGGWTGCICTTLGVTFRDHTVTRCQPLSSWCHLLQSPLSLAPSPYQLVSLC